MCIDGLLQRGVPSAMMASGHLQDRGELPRHEKSPLAKRDLVDLRIIVRTHRLRISEMCKVFQGEVDHALSVFHAEAQRLKRGWNAKVFVQFRNGVGEVCAFLQAHGLAQAGIFCIGRAFVEAQDVRQEHGVQRAMVQLLVVQAACRVGEGVHAAKTFHEGERAFIACHHHVPARIRVRPVLHGFLQPAITDRAIDAVIADAFRRRIDARGEHGSIQ